MAIIVIDKETSESIEFPMLPDKISVQAAQSFVSFRLLTEGEVKLANGEELTAFSWQGMLPGQSRSESRYVSSWISPRTMQEKFSVWRNSNHKLQLTIDETPIDHPVYLQNYTCEYAGGNGDYFYTISFIHAKEVIVSTTAAPAIAAAAPPKAATAKPSTAPKAKSYTVVKGDSPWAIAQKLMGGGANYPKLIAANKAAIDSMSKKYHAKIPTIYPGMVLTIP